MDLLPTELQSLVFLWGLPNSKYRFKVVRYRRSISQVCRCWRTICLDTPRLWRAVYIIIDAFLSCHNWQVIEPLIRRAKKVPLDLTIDVFRNLGTASYLLRRLKPCIHRLRELRFTSTHLEPLLEFFPLPRSMPYLKTLDICLTEGRWDDQSSVELWECNSSYPTLESFTIDGIGRFFFQSISSDQMLDLNITMVHASSFGDREDLKYITNFRRLRSLGLHLYPPEVEALKCLLSFSQGSLHSLKLHSTMGAVPRLMGDTSLIHHLELITCGHHPLNVF